MKSGPAPGQLAVVGPPDEALPASFAPPVPPAASQRSTQSALDSTPAIADHELVRVIGRGSYGEVWLARHTRLGTLRAVKIVRRDNFHDARPFQREFDGIRRYEPISRAHPNLIAILHVGGTDECFYYVMELADATEAHGKAASNQCSVISNQSSALNTDYWSLNTSQPKTLRRELKQHGSLPIDRCLEIAHALASALAHLHANGLVHRDVKPSNVIFAGGVAKLADIGLVAGVDDARSFVGTEGYIPPEGPGTPSADCYSLGKLLYELSTGHDRTAWPEPPADLVTRPDRERMLELNAVLHRACAPDPRDRYKSAEEMRAELEL
jgi:eukaryotic-like serine/threonine-protein kinase